MIISFIKYANLVRTEKDVTVNYDIGSNSLAPRRGDYVELEGLEGRVASVRWVLGTKSIAPKLVVVLED